MTANVMLRFILLYGVPAAALGQAVTDITAAVAEGALTELPSQRFGLDGIAEAHQAAEAGPTGKIFVVPS
jgi:NADPH2:quinone reductase